MEELNQSALYPDMGGEIIETSHGTEESPMDTGFVLQNKNLGLNASPVSLYFPALFLGESSSLIFHGGNQPTLNHEVGGRHKSQRNTERLVQGAHTGAQTKVDPWHIAFARSCSHGPKSQYG